MPTTPTAPTPLSSTSTRAETRQDVRPIPHPTPNVHSPAIAGAGLHTVGTKRPDDQPDSEIHTAHPIDAPPPIARASRFASKASRRGTCSPVRSANPVEEGSALNASPPQTPTSTARRPMCTAQLSPGLACTQRAGMIGQPRPTRTKPSRVVKHGMSLASNASNARTRAARAMRPLLEPGRVGLRPASLCC